MKMTSLHFCVNFFGSDAENWRRKVKSRTNCESVPLFEFRPPSEYFGDADQVKFFNSELDSFEKR